MIVDTSAVVAILLAEPDAASYAQAIERASRRAMSAANFLETAIVIDRNVNPVSARQLDVFVTTSRIEIVPVTLAQARIAREAYRAYGRGNHPAGLNFGDCFAYALAKAAGRPLLYKGTDFAATDIEPAVRP